MNSYCRSNESTLFGM